MLSGLAFTLSFAGVEVTLRLSWQGFLASPAGTFGRFWVCAAAFLQGWFSSPDASEEDEESDNDDEEEQEARFLFFFGGPDLFFSEKQTLLLPASGRALLEALAGGDLASRGPGSRGLRSLC